jgi:hypothetical protein
MFATHVALYDSGHSLVVLIIITADGAGAKVSQPPRFAVRVLVLSFKQSSPS